MTDCGMRSMGFSRNCSSGVLILSCDIEVGVWESGMCESE